MEVLDRRSVLRCVLGSLEVSIEEPRALLAEYLRAGLLWSSEGSSAIHTTRILDNLAAVAEIAFPPRTQILKDDQALRDICRDLLDDLAAIGDVQDLGFGFWLPAPARFVRLAHSERALLVGGVPVSRFPVKLAKSIAFTGTSRTFPTALIEDFSAGGCAEEPLQGWLGHEEDLLSWTESELSKPLHPFTGEEGTHEFYAPLLKQYEAQPQYFRWFEDTEQLADGLYLARSRASGRPRQPMIARITAGTIEAIRELPREVEVRRLQYGLDARARNPVHVVVKQYPRSTTFSFTSPLPSSMHRFFLAIGKLEFLPNGKRFPYFWLVPREVEASVRSELARLLVRLR